VRTFRTNSFHLVPEEDDGVTAGDAASAIELHLATGNGSAALKLTAPDGSGVDVELPRGVVEALLEVLRTLGGGRGVTLNRLSPEVSPFQAAQILNVSEAYVEKLLERGELKLRAGSSLRLLSLVDLLAFAQRSHIAREEALDELTRIAQEEGDYG
jgi:hypothetical protein